MTENLICPYDKQPCIKEQCMAWSGKQNLDELQRDHKDGFEAIIGAIRLQEGCSRETAIRIIEVRNNNERCKLIDPEQPI